MFVVFDLDGTLANGDHRLHYIASEPKDWTAYFAACGDDAPIMQALQVLMAIAHSYHGHRVEIWTGRSDEVRPQTEAWLRALIQPCHFNAIPLIMRAAGDHRNDDVLKAEWVAQRGKPDLVFEDRDRVVAMWRANGVACFQVAPGAF